MTNYFIAVPIIYLNSMNSVVNVVYLIEAVSLRLTELLDKQHMTQYALFKKTGVPKQTINNIVRCGSKSVELRIIHELCQGLDVSLTEFFDSKLFDEDNLEP